MHDEATGLFIRTSIQLPYGSTASDSYKSQRVDYKARRAKVQVEAFGPVRSIVLLSVLAIVNATARLVGP